MLELSKFGHVTNRQYNLSHVINFVGEAMIIETVTP